MQNKQKLNAEIGLVLALKSLAESYETISVMRMQKVRNSVLSVRDFFDKLSEVFLNVKTSYRQEIMKLIEENTRAKKTSSGFISLTTGIKNGKTALLLISSKERLYGDLTYRVFEMFADHVKKEPKSDIIIIGAVGEELFKHRFKGKEYALVELPDTGVRVEDFKGIISKIINYERVNVFYGKFANIFRQEPAVSSVTGEQALEEEGIDHRTYFFFEPNLEKVVNFFEDQAFSALFKQTLNEAELARYASRLQAMENALDNIHLTQVKLKKQAHALKRMVEDKKRIETFSGINLWK